MVTARSLAALSLLALGCAKDKVQPISGQVARATSPGPVTSVRVVRAGDGHLLGRR